MFKNFLFKKILNSLLFFSFLFSCNTQFSQDKEVENNNEIDYLIENAPDNFFTIDSIFKKQKNNKKQILLLLEESEKNSYLIGLAYAHNTLGKYYRNRSFFKESIENHQKTIDIAKKIKNVEAEIVGLNMIGVAYRRQDAIRNALDYHQAALSLADSIKNPSIHIKTSISVSENSIGNIYLALKQYNLALEQFKKSIILQREVNNKLGLAINYQNIGFAHEELGNLNEALSNYEESLKYNNEINSRIGKIICKNSIGSVLIKEKKYFKAEKTIESILDLAIKINDKYYLSDTYNRLGWAQINTNKLEKAEENLNKGLDISEEYNIQSHVIDACIHLSDLNEKKNNNQLALFYYKKAKEKESELFNDKNLLYVNDLIIKYGSERQTDQINDLARQNEITKLQLYKTRNFWISSFGFLALFGVILFSYNRHQSLKDEKKILMLKQDALRSQMNPHFMFNALNSIKLYIINNDKKKATSYLNKFSKLMRKILDASSVKVISLAEELETMNLYMSIENIRFSSEIEFTTNIDEGVNLNTVKIPPLVLQPFLENAIWHGLSSKKGDKKVTLDIKKLSQEFIQIEIKDNGIGREESAKIKLKKSFNRKSIGINLTKERLKSFVKDLRNSFSLVYYDLKDDKGNANGTKAVLKIPLL